MYQEIAERLMSTGFPQKQECGECGEFKGSTIYFPTLSELIEACGDDFWSLVQKGSNQWWCENSHGTLSGKGLTPKEAVANLWLALNNTKPLV